ncbi:MAG: CaiB/BaiF CoA-transferase family protein, partial [Paracoccus sp. (in: a-proteobacteria)]|uniref:CaiB/BaiF CoA transferase family protein n=1 Tax=Paracoccus sp. TaxID=267 RepID=UPI0039E3C919
MIQPLSGLKVLDFSTTLPGPLATLMLAEAGATVIKVERSDGGDPGRFNKPQIADESLQFAMLNKGKRSLAVDLKSPAERDAVLKLAAGADVLIDQFRPGVMERLGLGYGAVSALNPRIVYCAITGFGQTGPNAQRAGHDLTYLARNGLLSLGGAEGGALALPPALIADLGGGTYPAVINILLALAQRQRTGQGSFLDIAMAEQGFPWISRQLAVLTHDGAAPRPGESSHTGGTPRYALHRASDGKYIAVAAIEAKFWRNFCDTIDLPETLRDPGADKAQVHAAIAERIGAHPSDHWAEAFAGDDFAVEVVRDLAEA